MNVSATANRSAIGHTLVCLCLDPGEPANCTLQLTSLSESLLALKKTSLQSFIQSYHVVLSSVSKQFLTENLEGRYIYTI